MCRSRRHHYIIRRREIGFHSARAKYGQPLDLKVSKRLDIFLRPGATAV